MLSNEIHSSISYFLSLHSEKTIFNGIKLKASHLWKGKGQCPQNPIQQNWPLTSFILTWPPLSSRTLEMSCYCLVPRRGRGYEKINAASTKEQQLHRFKSLTAREKLQATRRRYWFDEHVCVFRFMMYYLRNSYVIWQKKLDVCPYDHICVSMIYPPVYSFETKNKEYESSKFETLKGGRKGDVSGLHGQPGLCCLFV